MTCQNRAQRQRDLGQALDITVEHHRALADSWDREVQEWSVTAVAADLDAINTDSPPDPVCRLEMVKVSLGHPDQAQLMDAHSLQLDWVRNALLDDAGELREDRLDADVLIGGNAILVVTEVEVEPAYAGLDLDQLITLEAISLLGDGCDLAAAVTIDTPGLPQTVESLDNNRSRRSWREIGFQPVTDQVMVVYLAMTTPGEHLRRLRTSFGVLAYGYE